MVTTTTCFLETLPTMWMLEGWMPRLRWDWLLVVVKRTTTTKSWCRFCSSSCFYMKRKTIIGIWNVEDLEYTEMSLLDPYPAARTTWAQQSLSVVIVFIIPLIIKMCFMVIMAVIISQITWWSCWRPRRNSVLCLNIVRLTGDDYKIMIMMTVAMIKWWLQSYDDLQIKWWWWQWKPEMIIWWWHWNYDSEKWEPKTVLVRQS